MAGCPAPDAAVFVELRTDFRPGTEFIAVQTSVDGELTTLPASGADDFLEFIRVAEVRGLSPGEHDVEVVLITPSGGPLYREPTSVTLERDRVVPVIIARDCADVVCGTGEKCAGGRCVPEDCQGDDPSCPPPICEEASDCVSTAPACVTPICTGVACLWALRDELCGPAERCDAVLGCQGDGPLDGGAEEDAGVDAGGPADAGAPDAGGCLIDADCPGDVFPPFGACRFDTSMGRICNPMGLRDRTTSRWQCVGRACELTETEETEPCTFDPTGRECTTSSDRDCLRCAGVDCTPVPDGTHCSPSGIRTGGCRSGVCCIGCWADGMCVGEGDQTNNVCGADGADCQDCEPAGLYCEPLWARGGECRP